MEMKVLNAIYFLPQSTDCFGLHAALWVHTLASWSGINIFKSLFIATQTLFSFLLLIFPM